jgi:hypothetical protein
LSATVEHGQPSGSLTGDPARGAASRLSIELLARPESHTHEFLSVREKDVDRVINGDDQSNGIAEQRDRRSA